MRIEVLYFASLRDASGTAQESIETAATDAASLYDELRLRYGFALPRERLRVAIDGEFASWGSALHEGAEVALLPPVSGG